MEGWEVMEALVVERPKDLRLRLDEGNIRGRSE